jgi:hypothetical protein
VFGLAFMTAMIVAGTIGEYTSELGLQLSDVTPAGTALRKALVLRDQQFNFYTVSVGTGEADYSERETQQNLKRIWDQVNELPHILKDSGISWISAFIAWGVPTVPMYDQTIEKRVCDADSPTTKGYCGQMFNCIVETEHPSIVNDRRIPFFKQSEFYRCLNTWINYDLVYEALGPGFSLVDASAPRGARELYLYYRPENDTKILMPYSQGGFFANNVEVNSDFVALIHETESVCNETSQPPTFAFGDPITYWNQYLNLREVIAAAIGLAVLIKFLAIAFIVFAVAESDIPNERGNCRRLIVAVWTSLIVVAVVSMMTTEVYGFISYAGVKISAIPAISILMSIGVGVNIAAHMALAFVNAHGTRRERAITALDIFFAPTIDGGITTLLGVVLLSASSFAFVVKYFFVVWCIIVGLGVFNGVLVLPVLLTIIGPPNLHLRGGKRPNVKRVVGSG